jgi:hypothetical protein
VYGDGEIFIRPNYGAVPHSVRERLPSQTRVSLVPHAVMHITESGLALNLNSEGTEFGSA